MPSKLAKRCMTCRYKDTCQNKRMEAYAYLQPATQNNMAELVQPMLKKVDLRDIKIDVNTTVTIDLEQIKEQLKFKSFENGGF